MVFGRQSFMRSGRFFVSVVDIWANLMISVLRGYFLLSQVVVLYPVQPLFSTVTTASRAGKGKGKVMFGDT